MVQARQRILSAEQGSFRPTFGGKKNTNTHTHARTHTRAHTHAEPADGIGELPKNHHTHIKYTKNRPMALASYLKITILI